MRALLLGLVALAGCAAAPWSPPGDTQAKREVIAFIERKLAQPRGEGWERSGQYQATSLSFSRDGCTLHLRRQDLYSTRVWRESLPLDRTRPGWGGQSALLFQCVGNAACIDYWDRSAERQDEGQRRETRLLVPDPNDLPKLQDAFTELNRLCDDPYRLPPEGPPFPRGQDFRPPLTR